MKKGVTKMGDLIDNIKAASSGHPYDPADVNARIEKVKRDAKDPVDALLDESTIVLLTGLEKTMIRDALRLYIDGMFEHVRNALESGSCVAAAVHEQQMSKAIEIFSKM